MDAVRDSRGSSHVKRALFYDPGLRGWFEISVGVTEDRSEVTRLPFENHVTLCSVIDRWHSFLQGVCVACFYSGMARSSLELSTLMISAKMPIRRLQLGEVQQGCSAPTILQRRFTLFRLLRNATLPVSNSRFSTGHS